MKTIIYCTLSFLFFLCFSGCHTANNEPGGDLSWAKGAVWYQIFPERFRNGDTSNDPTVQEVPETDNPDWQISPWTSDWYKMQPWEKKTGEPFYSAEVVFARRYGGDLIGVINKLDYLQELGIDAIYFNPLFEAQSLHKYDGATYHHIDDNFGPDPVADRKRLSKANETEAPSSWIWTKADSTFLKLLDEAHQRGIKIVIDGVFNHTGRAFFAFQDILEKGKDSKYASWYDITSWDDLNTPENEFDYKGWWGVKSLPEFAENEQGLVSGPREYIFAATKRWMDPNGDGDPSDGIDGWRLDVAQEVAAPFWREWYAHVKSINPNAITVAEIWEDASDWIKNEQMDNTMNYLFAKAVVDFFIDQKTAISGAEFTKRMQTIIDRYGENTAHILWNLLDSHDTDRLPSMIINPDRRYDQKNRLTNNPDYKIRKPSPETRKIQKQIAALQMTMIGSPMIYYGDEAGMWGADDPDDRKPMLWPDMEFAKERSHPLSGMSRPADPNYFDQELFQYYKNMIQVRHENPAFQTGNIMFLKEVIGKDHIAFSRSDQSQQAIVVFNRSKKQLNIDMPKKYLNYSEYANPLSNKVYRSQNNSLTINVQPKWFLILIST